MQNAIMSEGENCFIYNLTDIIFSTTIEGFTVAEAILVVGQTRQNLQWIYGKKCDFDAW